MAKLIPGEFKKFLAEAEARDPEGFARARAEMAELEAMRKDAERYRWLRSRLLAVDWDYMGTGDTVLVFTAPPEVTVSADCDATMDSAMAADPANGAA